MSFAKHKPATDADLVAVPTISVAEIPFGNIVTHRHLVSRLGRARSTLASRARTTSYQFDNEGAGGWIVSIEPLRQPGPRVEVRDIANPPWEALSLINAETHLTIAPD